MRNTSPARHESARNSVHVAPAIVGMLGAGTLALVYLYGRNHGLQRAIEAVRTYRDGVRAGRRLQRLTIATAT